MNVTCSAGASKETCAQCCQGRNATHAAVRIFDSTLIDLGLSRGEVPIESWNATDVAFRTMAECSGSQAHAATPIELQVIVAGEPQVPINCLRAAPSRGQKPSRMSSTFACTSAPQPAHCSQLSRTKRRHRAAAVG